MDGRGGPGGARYSFEPDASILTPNSGKTVKTVGAETPSYFLVREMRHHRLFKADDEAPESRR